MDDATIETLTRLLAASDGDSPRPWRATSACAVHDATDCYVAEDVTTTSDAALIVAAVNALPELLTDLAALRARCAALAGALAAARAYREAETAYLAAFKRARNEAMIETQSPSRPDGTSEYIALAREARDAAEREDEARATLDAALAAAAGDGAGTTPADGCAHGTVRPGPRVPLRYGSAATDVCADCGAWRTQLHGAGPWRPGAALAEALRSDDDV